MDRSQNACRSKRRKCVFHTKEDGSNKKTQIVAKGFQSQEDYTFEPLYAPVARMTTIKIISRIFVKRLGSNSS